MIKAIVYSPEGYELHTVVESSASIVSRLDPDRAVETWKAGLVRGQLAIRTKTVQSVDRFLRRAADGALVEITYELVSSGEEIQETRTVHHFARESRPVLLPAGAVPLNDRQIVSALGARLGSYIRVSYRLMDRHEADLDLPEPYQSSYAENLPRILVAVE